MTHFDDLETRSADEREKDLFSRLPGLLADATSHCPALADHLSDVEVTAINSRSALETLPVLYKSALMHAQQQQPPFGGFVNQNLIDGRNGASGTRVFMSPGPVWEPQAPGLDPWQAARAMYAAGIRTGQRVHNAFSYHLTPGGFIMDEGAQALGCQVFPAGVGNTDGQVEAAAFFKPEVYAGTPDFLKILLDRAEEQGTPLNSINRGLVSGGALFPAMREEYAARGVNVLQCYATADLGVIAYESEKEGQLLPGMICNENIIVEIVRPGTNVAVAAGEVGELVVTNFNPAYPLIRFGTGDLSCAMPGHSDCGRTNMRIKGWMGRADQRTKVKGMFVDPKQVAQLVESQSGIGKARLVVSRDGDSDSLKLLVEQAANGDAVDTAALEASMQQILKLRGSVELADQALPNDGLVIADERDYQH